MVESPATDSFCNIVADVVKKHLPKVLSQSSAPYINPATKMWDMPHTLIHGSSVCNSRILLERILLTHVYNGTAVMPKASDATFESRDLKDITLQYKSYPKHIEYELHSNMTLNEREAFIEMLQSFTQSQSITGLPKNVIVLHGLEAIHNKHDYALRKLIEGIQSVAWLLMDVESLSKIIDPIKSRCTSVSSRMNFEPISKEIAEATCCDVNTVKLILAQDKNHDVIEVSLRLQMPGGNGHLYIGHVKAWTAARLKELQSAYLAALEPKATVKAITKYTQLLRETTQHLMNTGIPVSTWLKYVIDVCANEEHSNIHDIVALAAKNEAQHKTKDALVLDAFIHELMFLL